MKGPASSRPEPTLSPGGVRWSERRAEGKPPPLGELLTGWTILKERRSHWNARRVEAGKEYHLKWFFHGPLLCRGRTEWRNALRLEALGVPTVVPVGWGRHPRGSFIVLEGSPGAPGDAWSLADRSPAALDRATRALARAAARFHDAGLCHRDLNVYHVLIDGDHIRIIDVGRVTWFWRRRWIVKDLASLLASSRRENFPEWCARLFLRAYLAATARRWSRRGLIQAVERKAERYRRHLAKHAMGSAGRRCR